MSREAEEQIIGALLMDHTLINQIDVMPNEFLDGFCREVFIAAQELTLESKAFDVVLLAERLKQKTGKDWLLSLAEIGKNTFGRSVGEYSKAVKRDYQIFQAKDTADRLSLSVDELGAEAIDKAIQELMQLNISKKNYSHSMKQALEMSVNHIDEIHELDGLIGVPTGLNELDQALSGFRDGDLYVIGARPAMGKTALLLNMIYGAKDKVAMFSAEQGIEQIGLRLCSIAGRVNSRSIRTGNFSDADWQALNAAVSILSEKDVWFYDKPAPSIVDIQRQARQWKHNYGIKAIYIDYIQRIKGTNPRLTTVEKVTQVTEGLKELARELNIPVISLAQVNRDVERRDNKRPGMNELSDSSAIEKEADCIMTLYRDEVYNPNSDAKGLAEIAICKNRHGPIGTVMSKWESQFMIFSNLETQYYGS